MLQLTLEQFLTGWIVIMDRVIVNERRFNLRHFQQCRSRPFFCVSENSIIDCGAAACGAGWLAVSDFWKGLGGKVGNIGQPFYKGNHPVLSAVHMGATGPLSDGHDMADKFRAIIYGDHCVYGTNGNKDEVTAEMFRDALIRYRNTGSPYLNSYLPVNTWRSFHE